MSTTYELYVRWVALHGLESERAAMTTLGVSHGAAQHWKAGRNASPAVVERMARDLGEDAGVAVLKVQAEGALGPDRKVWTALARRLASAAAVLLVTVAGYCPAPASAAGTRLEATDGLQIYIMRSAARLFSMVRAAWRSLRPRPANWCAA